MRALTSERTLAMVSSSWSRAASTTRSIHPATVAISEARRPREVSDGVPIRRPDGSKGLRGSNGTVL